MNKETFINPCDDYKRWSISEDCGCGGSMISYEQTPKTKCDCDAIRQEFEDVWQAIDEIEVSGSCECDELRDEISAVSSSLSAHLSDDVSHITSEERTAWNAKLDASAYTPSSSSCECDLSEVNDRLTALESVSGQCHCSFDDYYTKEQVDALIEAAISSGGSSSDRNFLYQTIDISGNVETVLCGDGLSGSTIYLKPIDYIGKNIVSFIVGKCATEIPNHCFSVISQTLKRLDLNGGNLITIGTNIISVSGSVKTIYVPSTVETIGDYAFEEAEKIIFQSPVPPSIGRSIGGDTQNGALIYVPSGSKELYEDVYNLYQYRDFNRIIEY